MKEALVVGYGSIGKRHARILSKSLNLNVSICSAHYQESTSETQYTIYRSLENALTSTNPDYVVICNTTADHFPAMQQLEKHQFSGVALVEKPVFSHMPHPAFHPSYPCYIAYNLRTHSIMQRLKQALDGSHPISAHFYVGQHLSQWRTSCDQYESYSGCKGKGGGVLRDLSHEIDAAQYLFGPIRRFKAIGGRFSEMITHDAEDHATIVLECGQSTFVTIHLNYIDHVATREYMVHTDTTSLRANFSDHSLTDARDGSLDIPECDGDESYRRMHQAIVERETASLCSYAQGTAIVEWINSEYVEAWR